jgi:DUF4097 and DUF4098 domain-containing protein YvlB
MSTFLTPQPISVTVELSIGQVRISASDRTDTFVEVRPSDPADGSDVRAAEQVQVDFANGGLRITGPKARTFDFSRSTKSVDVVIDLPTGSKISAELQLGDVHCTGALGDCNLKSSAGNLWVEQADSLRAQTSAGHVTAKSVSGDVEISTSSGKVQLGQVGGSAVVLDSNGDTDIDAVTGNLRVRAANGSIRVERAGAGVDAKTSNGSIRVGEVVQGSVLVETAMGDLDVGIAEDTAAWLEVNTSFGRVRNLLDPTSRPAESDRTVEVRGRTSYGDITVRRA